MAILFPSMHVETNREGFVMYMYTFYSTVLFFYLNSLCCNCLQMQHLELTALLSLDDKSVLFAQRTWITNVSFFFLLGEIFMFIFCHKKFL